MHFSYLVLIVTTFFSAKNHAVELSDFRVMCDIQVGTTALTSLPPMCTAVSVGINTDDALEGVKKFRGDLPLMYVVNNVEYEDWEDYMEPSNGRAELIITINKYKIDAICFNHFYSGDESPKSDQKRINKIVEFVDKLKENFPDKKFGMVLPNNGTLIKHQFNVAIMDPRFDFYLASTFDYRECEHEDHQSEMTPTSRLIDIEGTLQDIEANGFDLKKCFITLDIRAHNVKPVSNRDKTPYSVLCTKKFGRLRKFCIDTLDEVVQKARLVVQHKLIGICVYSAGFDDYDGSCNCEDEKHSKEFPILKSILMGLQNCETAGVLGTCKSWNVVHQ